MRACVCAYVPVLCCVVHGAATFDTKMPVDSLFFIGNQLVVLSNVGRVAVWQSMTRHWQVQEVVPICSFDRAGSFLLLGCANGSIYHIGEWECDRWSGRGWGTEWRMVRWGMGGSCGGVGNGGGGSCGRVGNGGDGGWGR